TPSAATASVMECATVKAVTAAISLRAPLVPSRTAARNRRWSQPLRMCSTPIFTADMRVRDTELLPGAESESDTEGSLALSSFCTGFARGPSLELTVMACRCEGGSRARRGNSTRTTVGFLGQVNSIESAKPPCWMNPPHFKDGVQGEPSA